MWAFPSNSSKTHLFAGFLAAFRFPPLVENQQSINSDRFLKTKPEFIFYGMAVSVARHTQLHCYL